MNHSIISFLLYLLLQSSYVLAQNITIGASLSAIENSSSWLSPSKDFAFGFQKIDKHLFLLSIWFNKIPEKTIVWYAINGNNNLVPRGSKVELNANTGLVLTTPQGQQLWTSQEISGVVATGFMNNKGNFVVQDENYNTLWDSFGNPSDTILPSQTLDHGMIMSSRRTETNFSKGRFQLRLQNDGDLVLTSINLPSDNTNEPYYKSDTKGDSTSVISGLKLVFNDSAYMYILRNDDGRVLLKKERHAPSIMEFYHRATLNFDGVLTQYFYPKSSTSSGQSWSTLWSLPDDICVQSFSPMGSGPCGYNSICKLGEDQRPNCECPEGYSLLDRNDLYGSCKSNFSQSCEEDESGSAKDIYELVEITNVDWPTSDYALLQPFTEDQCRESCLNDCMCAVAIFTSGDMCWKKKFPLSNGRLDPTINGKAMVKIMKGSNRYRPDNSRAPLPEFDKQKKDQEGLVVLVSALFGTSVFVNFLFGSALCFGFFFIYRKKSNIQQRLYETNLRCYTYEELVEATNDFREQVGRGAFGVVYKGELSSYPNVKIAVKKLGTLVHDYMKEFKAEVNIIGQTHHKNLVRLLGFCDEGVQRLLVYEYMSNGTLASFLFGDIKPGWNQRTGIALQIARGLLYLHEECSTQIIHCDIKPQNILLDEYYNVKISDFGLAKLLLLDQSQTQTGIRGTKGYVAPEWFRNKPITVKVDVYSFGTVLLELICCRKNVEMEISVAGKAILTDFAYDCYVEGTLDCLVENDVEALGDGLKLERFFKVGLWCVNEDPSIRPTMKMVSQMLEGVVEVPAPPSPYPSITSHYTID